MTALSAIADLQDLDTRLEQLRHRREHLPERALLVDLASRARDLDGRRTGLRRESEVLAAEQRRLEDEVDTIEAKASRENDRLYGGTVTAPRELEALQAEIASLRSRQGVLEDRILELMEAIEPLDRQLSRWDGEVRSLSQEGGQVQERLAGAEAELEAETAEVQRRREDLAGTIDADLLARYEERRRRMGGVVVGRLRSGTCTACSLGLSAVDLDRIAHLAPDEPVDCPECGVILVR